MEKLYKKIGWKNSPNLATPLGATNLNKMDVAIDGLDNRTIELNNKDAEQGRHIEELYAETRNNAQAIEEVRESTQYIDSSKIVTNKSGSPAYIDDASNMNIENIVFYGESKQETTTGKNLLQNTATTLTKDGITFTVKDGIVTANGTATAQTYFVVLGGNKGRESFLGKEIILSGCPSGGGSDKYYLQFYHYDKNNSNAVEYGSGTKVTFTNDTTDFNVSIIVKSGVTMNNVKFYPMIRLASITDATYEPYTGGKASPNPDYPQMIEPSSVGSVSVYGKNLLKNTATSKTIDGITFTVSSDGTITANGTATNLVYLDINTNLNTENLEGCIFSIFTDNAQHNANSYVARISSQSDRTGLQDFMANDVAIINKGKSLRLAIRIADGCVMNNVVFKPMIRPSFFTDGTYEPYQTQFASLTSSMYFLDGIGDLKNYIDIERGVLVEKVKNVTFDGSADEHWATYDTGSGKKRLFSNSVSAKSNANNSTIPNIMSNKYKAVTPTNTYYDIEGITISTGANPILYLYDDVYNDGDITKWRNHLKSSPLTVVYELATPIETAIPTAELNELRAMLKLHTYKPNTIVDAQDTLIDVQYVADTKAYIDNKFKELATAIVNQ